MNALVIYKYCFGLALKYFLLSNDCKIKGEWSSCKRNIFQQMISTGCHHQNGEEFKCMCMKVLMIPRQKQHKFYFKSKSRPRKQRSTRKLSLSLSILKESLGDCKGLTSQHNF